MSWKNLSLRAKLVLGFGFSVIILLIIAGMALYDTARLTQLTAARATARQFLWNLEQLVSLSRSAANDARGYMLTGEQHFIATFEDDVKKLPTLFADLEKGDPAQRDARRGAHLRRRPFVPHHRRLARRRRTSRPVVQSDGGSAAVAEPRHRRERCDHRRTRARSDAGQRSAAGPLAQTDAAQRGGYRRDGEAAHRHPHH